MDIESFMQHLAGELVDTPADQIRPETHFREFDGWNSLAALSVIAMCDEEYGVTLKGDDIKNAKTVRDLFDTVSRKVNRGVL